MQFKLWPWLRARLWPRLSAPVLVATDVRLRRQPGNTYHHVWRIGDAVTVHDVTSNGRSVPFETFHCDGGTIVEVALPANGRLARLRVHGVRGASQ